VALLEFSSSCKQKIFDFIKNFCLAKVTKCSKLMSYTIQYNTTQICIAPLVASESEALGDSV